MSKPLTVSVLLFLIFFADVLSIQQTVRFWQKDSISNEGVSIFFLLLAQAAVASALLFCGGFILYKSFSKKDENDGARKAT